MKKKIEKICVKFKIQIKYNILLHFTHAFLNYFKILLYTIKIISLFVREIFI